MSNATCCSPNHPRKQIHSVAAHLIALGISGLLLGLAFPEPGWGILAHIALVPAGLVAIRSTSATRLAWTSCVVWFTWWLWVLHWLYPVTGGGYAAMCACLAVYLTLALLGIRWLAQHPRTLLTLAVPAVWTSLELVRGRLFAGGFSWFALAHTQAAFRADQSPGLIVQTADLFGEQTVTFLVAMTNGLILDLLVRPWVVARGDRRGLSRSITLACSCWVAATLSAVVYGNVRVAYTDRSHAMSVAVVQTNIPQDNKNHPTPEKQQADWHRLLELTRLAAHPTDASPPSPPPDLIVWPETVTPAPVNPKAREYFNRVLEHYRDTDPEQVTRFQRLLGYHTDIADLAREINTAILAGGPAYEFDEPLRRYNAAYLYHRSGHQADHHYNKIHRVPFGEYIPWVESWPWLKKVFIKYLSPYETDYTLQPGSTYTVLKLPISDHAPPNHAPIDAASITAPPRIARMGPSICFEDTVARVTRRMAYDDNAHKRIDLLVNLTNDGWYSGYAQRQLHLQIAVLRSIENRIPTARAVNTGISGFISSTGRITGLVQADGQSQNVQGVATEKVWFDPRVTLFGRFGHTPMTVLALATAAWLYMVALRPILKARANA